MTSRVYEYTGLAEDIEVERLVLASLQFYFRYYARFSALHFARRRRRLVSSVDASGAAALARASSDRGVLLASVHLGEFDVAGAWLSQELGRKVVVVTDQVTPWIRQAFFDHARTESGLVLKRREDTRLDELERDLTRGRIVLWMFDRVAPGPAVAGSLLGRPAALPIAPVVVAKRTGAALMCATTTTGASHRPRLYATQPLQLEGQSTEGVLSQVAACLSTAVRRCPWQWHIPADTTQLPFEHFRTLTAEAPLKRLAYPASRSLERVYSGRTG